MPSVLRRERIITPSVKYFDARNYGLGTLKGWFDACDLRLADGASVTTWADKSGNGNDATAGTSPVYKTGIQNGLPGVLFTAASSQFLAANGLASIQNGADLPVSVALVVRSVSLGAFQRYACWGRTTSNGPFMLVGQTNVNVYEVVRSDDTPASITRPSSAAVDTSAHVFTMVFSGTTTLLDRDGVAVISASLDVGNLTIDRFSIGCFGRIANANFFDGYIHELIVYASALSWADRSAIEIALGKKWGIIQR